MYTIAWLLQLLGAGLVFVALGDIFLTVLCARSGTSLISHRLHQHTWQFLRRCALALPAYKDRLLAYAGPGMLVLTVLLWVILLLL